MVLHLYGSSKATCTRRVATVLHEKGVPFVLHPIDIMKGEQKSVEYLEKQPFGQVPYIDDDGFILYESRAICQYIALKYADRGVPLIPTDLNGQALFYQAASTETANFDPYAQAVVKEKVFKPMFGMEPDQKVFDDALAVLTSKLDVYEKILSKQKYLAGDVSNIS
ncbi:hypothetical protein D9613_012469 [Agrocybe pediades]|uniref:glutathione transferase n=1 Tax=Agrocybe pediades TaxID=84607 RepID=A0A8H4VPM4_9AGAR|nr:hypothetical protein D9613_012469 [Agrocybe pediades]